MEYRSALMTVAEVAEYLKLSEKTILKMIKNKEIPCAKIANQWRFSLIILEDWLTAKMDVIPQNDLSRLIEKEYDLVPVSRLIHEDNIIIDLKSDNRMDVLEELAENAYSTQLISDKGYFLKKLVEREKITSTALGNGVAIPHLRKPSDEIVNEARIIIGRSEKGIDFDSLDTLPTHIFFLLISDSEIVHLRLLSKLGIILKQENSIDLLRSYTSKSDFISFFTKFDKYFLNKEING